MLFWILFGLAVTLLLFAASLCLCRTAAQSEELFRQLYQQTAQAAQTKGD